MYNPKCFYENYALNISNVYLSILPNIMPSESTCILCIKLIQLICKLRRKNDCYRWCRHFKR